MMIWVTGALLVATLSGGVVIWRQRARLALLDQVLQGVDQGICVLDDEQRVVLWNRRMERLCNIDATRMREGMPLERYLASSGPSPAGECQPLSMHAQGLTRSLFKQRSFALEVELEDGRILHSQGSPVGQQHMLLTYTDVGHIKRSQLAFRDLATRLAATLENVLDGVITFDDHGIIDSFSSGAELLFGTTAGAVLGTNIRVLIPEVYTAIQDAAGGTHPLVNAGRPRREMDARRKNGQQVPIEVATSELRVAGRPLFICIVRDIAERRRVERLQQEFIATVSHELRTPLTSIVGALGLMGSDSQTSLPATSRRLLHIAQQNGERLQRLIDDILESVKTNVEALDLTLEPHAINKLISATAENNLSFAARLNVRLNVNLPQEDVVARVDPSRLQQVLTNLISNAAKFSPAGECVQVTLKRERAYAQITVVDNGPGIPDSFRSRIFEKFSQADSSDSRMGSGTGLGLYIARKLVTRMGGMIDFHSLSGHGTTFRVLLPLEQEGRLRGSPSEELVEAGT